MQGTIKFFNETKAFGFITPDQGGEDIFVHISGVTQGPDGQASFQPRENDKVSYEVEQGKKGPQAYNVTRLESNSN